jgi:molecular chaperone HtpG
MTTGTLKIHTENILPIIKKWLYSDKDIFVRELVSNACDAIQKCKVLREHGELSTPDEDFRIDIRVDKNARTLIFLDNGIGMTSEEVEKYIAQIAFSGAEEFIGKYSSQNEKDHIIGHFGLGFYSSYMVAEKVAIDTLSYRPHSAPSLWTCDGSSSYSLDSGAKETRGTEITLFIAKESEEFLEESRLRQILQHYCAFLPFPIYLNGSQINKKQPLWMKNASDCSDAEYIDFYHTLYPLESNPIFWIHLNIDYPFHLKGILYFPKITRRFDWNQNSIKLFCNRVFVSDNCKDLIPDYLMILQGAIDSPDIPLNVSRSTLQMDRTVRQLSTHISKKITDKLSSLYTADREKFLAFWPDIEMIIKLGMLQDDKFYERSKDFLVWKTLSGEWTTAAEYIQRHKDAYKGKVFYTAEDQKLSHALDLYKQKGIEILTASSMVDTPIISLLESKLDDVKFQRIDSTVDEAILDSSREKTLLDSDGKTESFKIADFIRSKLTANSVEVAAKSLHDDSVPALLIVDEEMRRMRETMTLAQQQLPPDLGAKRTFVVNTNNKLIQSVYHLKEKDPMLAQEMVHHLYELSLLAQRELDPGALSQFVARSNRILEKMTQNSLYEGQ